MTPVRTVPDPLEILSLLARMNRGVERMSHRMEEELGVTAQQRLVVRVIGAAPGSTAGQLAERLHVDPGTISAVLRRLLAKNLVRRVQDRADRRRFTLWLTSGGRRIDLASEGTVEDAVRRVVASSSSEGLAEFVAVAGRLADVLAEEAERPRVPRRSRSARRMP